MYENLGKTGKKSVHPLDYLLRTDRIPHMWCPGCGIGTAFSSCLTAIKDSGIDVSKVVLVSGIGCSGRAAGYVNLDSFHATHGRAIPFATGLKMAKPELNIIVSSGDGDLFVIGGNHFIHAARCNVDITVVCINNLNYGMTGGQVAATTPHMAKTTTTLWETRKLLLICHSWPLPPGRPMWPDGLHCTHGSLQIQWRKRC